MLKNTTFSNTFWTHLNQKNTPKKQRLLGGDVYLRISWVFITPGSLIV